METKPFLLKPGDKFIITRDREKRVFQKVAHPDDSFSLDGWAITDDYKLERIVGNLDVLVVPAETPLGLPRETPNDSRSHA